MSGSKDLLDCLVVGAGPAGLTAALYLARFKRRFMLVDAGAPRAGWIPTSHNIPVFAEGISGRDILDRQRTHLARYGVRPVAAEVTALVRHDGGFRAEINGAGGRRSLSARRVLLATGSVDLEPDLPDVTNAVQQGLVRYCPICDGFEVTDRNIAVIGPGTRGLGEAAFIARSYTRRVTLLTLGRPLRLSEEERQVVEKHGIAIVEQPVRALDIVSGRITLIRTDDGAEHRFDAIYSALGLRRRSDLALALGAAHDDAGALLTDEHGQTSVRGLHAAGDVVRGLDQVVVAMGQAAAAATHIHNRCELPTEDEPGPEGRIQSP